MHYIQKIFCEDLCDKFPFYFGYGSYHIRVLEIGSLDVNGNINYLFNEDKCEITGLDVIKGKNVSIICIAHEYNEPDESFDVISSLNSLEHDKYWKLTLENMVRLLKPMGFIFISAAHRWPEHGTTKTSPHNSGTSNIEGWKNYYGNISPADINSVLNLNDIFIEYSLKDAGKDTQFWGIKRF